MPPRRLIAPWLIPIRQQRSRAPSLLAETMTERWGQNGLLISTKERQTGGLRIRTERFGRQTLASTTSTLPRPVTQHPTQITVLDGERVVGCLLFTKYRVDKNATDSLFHGVMSGQSEQNGTISKTFLRYWTLRDLFAPLLVLDMLWIAPGYGRRINWRTIVNDFYRVTRPDLMLLEAVPLGYDPSVVPRAAFERRQAALCALLAKQLRVERLAKTGGWMYRRASDFSQPMKQRNRIKIA